MANLSEKVDAELEQVERALRELPGARRMSKLSVLELAGTVSLLSSFYHGVEKIRFNEKLFHCDMGSRGLPGLPGNPSCRLFLGRVALRV